MLQHMPLPPVTSEYRDETWYNVLFFDKDWNTLHRVSETSVTWCRAGELLAMYHTAVSRENELFPDERSEWSEVVYVGVEVANEG